MTSFVVWTGVDSRGPASLYLASDSRISWPVGEGFDNWNCGRKVFAATRAPDVLGYVGDVLFPSLVLGQISAAIDVGALYPPNASPEFRYGRVSGLIKASFCELPRCAKHPFTIFYATREGEGMQATFRLWALTWTHHNSWDEESIPIPKVSSAIRVSGSGANVVDRWQSYWDSSSQGGTSRAVFGALCDAVCSGTDPRSGGAPQLVGLFRKSSGQTIGVVVDRTPYLLGLPIEIEGGQDSSSDMQWRNPLFERVSVNGDLLVGAQRHHAPNGLANSMDRGGSR